MTSPIEDAVAAKLLWARKDGSPVAPREEQLAAEMAAIARRRWNSWERRNANKADTLENRITDLARGLAEKFERGGLRMAGDLILDYTWLAEQIAPILAGGSRQ
jgi:hypothetical protein